jgi:hypothetical protein
VVYCDAYLMKIQVFDAEYLQLQLYCWLLYWSSHNQTKKERCLFSLFKFLETFLFFLSSSSSTRHIIYNYEINDKFFEYFKTRLLLQMDNYSAKYFYVSYFHFGSITTYRFLQFTYILLIVHLYLLASFYVFHLHNAILIYSYCH